MHRPNSMHNTNFSYTAVTSSTPSLSSETFPFTAQLITLKVQFVLLSTVRVEVMNKHGNYQPLRAVLDSGIMSSFITKKPVA